MTHGRKPKKFDKQWEPNDPKESNPNEDEENTQEETEIPIILMEMESEIPSIQMEMESEISKIQIGMELEIPNILMEMESEISSNQMEMKSAISRIQTEVESEISSILIQIKSAISKIQLEMESEIPIIQMETESEISSIQMKSAISRIQMMKSEISSTQMEIKSAISRIQMEMESEIPSIQMETESEISSLQRKMESAISLIQMMTSEISSIQMEMESEISIIEMETESEIPNIQIEPETKILNIRMETESWDQGEETDCDEDCAEYDVDKDDDDNEDNDNDECDDDEDYFLEEYFDKNILSNNKFQTLNSECQNIQAQASWDAGNNEIASSSTNVCVADPNPLNNFGAEPSQLNNYSAELNNQLNECVEKLNRLSTAEPYHLNNCEDISQSKCTSKFMETGYVYTLPKSDYDIMRPVERLSIEDMPVIEMPQMDKMTTAFISSDITYALRRAENWGNTLVEIRANFATSIPMFMRYLRGEITEYEERVRNRNGGRARRPPIMIQGMSVPYKLQIEIRRFEYGMRLAMIRAIEADPALFEELMRELEAMNFLKRHNCATQ